MKDVTFVEPIIKSLDETLKIEKESKDPEQLSEGIQQEASHTSQTEIPTLTDEVSPLLWISHERCKHFASHDRF